MESSNHDGRQPYALHRHLVLPSLIPASRADELAAMHRERGNWRQYTGHESCDGLPEMYGFFGEMSERVLEVVGDRGEQEMQCWVNRYKVGQSIFRHDDRSRHEERVAVAVLTVCLAAPPRENGGELVLAVDGGDVRILLQTGDAIVFDGARIEHWTTPLLATSDLPEPLRMVAVGRYYL